MSKSINRKILTSALIVLFLLSIIPVLAEEEEGIDLTVTVISNIFADAGGPYSGYRDKTITFDGTGSDDPDGTIEKYEWNFGDGGTGTGPNPSHIYSSTGTYKVTLTITDDDGFIDIDTADVTVTVYISPTVNALPVADAGADRTALLGIPASFDGSGSSDIDGTIVRYYWSFGDGGTGTGRSSSHTYTVAGTYTVSLTVTDNRGGTGSDSLTITVEEEATPEVIEDLPPDEAADIIEDMDITEAADIIEEIDIEAAADIIEEVSIETAADIIEEMNIESAADVIEEVSIETAADIVEEMNVMAAAEVIVEVEIEEAADIVEEMMDDAAVYVLVEVDTSSAATIMESVEEEDAGDLINAAVQTGITDQFSDIMLEMEENATAGALLASEPESGAAFVETMANKDLTRTAERVEAAVKLRARELEPEAQEELLNRAAEMLEEVSVESLVALFMEIITLPATPLTVATVFEVMDLEKVLEVVEAWIDLDAYEGLATVFDLLTQETLGKIYLDMSSADRAALYPYLSEETWALLPSLAVFQVSELTVTPSQVKTGENITISATVTNVGEESGEYTAILKVDGVTEETETVTLSVGESMTVSFTVSRIVIGVYTVEVDGQTGSFTVELVPLEPPVADTGGPYSVTVGRELTFDGTDSSDADGTIIKYEWDFGDGGTGEGPTPSHVYSSTGTYEVILTVTDDDGLTDSDQTTVTVTPRSVYVPGVLNIEPIADAGPNQTVDFAQMVEFSGINSTDPDGYLISWTWDFGDGTEAYGVNVSHRYLMADNYTVTLTVMDIRGGEDTDKCTITVMELVIPVPPLPPFFSNLIITPEEIELWDNVTISFDIMNPNDGAISYEFDMVIGEFTFPLNVELEAYETKTMSRTIFPTDVGTYNVTVMGLTGNFTVEPEAEPEPEPEPADFVVSDLSITPEEIELGEGVDVWTFEIIVYVTNVGEQEGTHTVDLKVDGDVIQAGTVTLWGGEETSITFDVTRGVGSYTVEVDELTGSFTVNPTPTPPPEPEFEVSDLTITPAEIELGDEVTVSFVITNADSRPYVFVPFLQIGDTMIMEDVELEGYESRTVSHTIIPESVGDYDVIIDGLEGSFTVFAVPAPISPGYVAGILIVIIAAAAIAYAYWKGIIPPINFKRE